MTGVYKRGHLMGTLTIAFRKFSQLRREYDFEEINL